MKERLRRLGLWSIMICLPVMIGVVASLAGQNSYPYRPGMPFIAGKACDTPMFSHFFPVPIPAVIPGYSSQSDDTGEISTYQPGGSKKTAGIGFFDSTLTANGRSCFTCHRPGNDWEIGLPEIWSDYYTTAGRSVLFQPIDSAVCPNAPGANAPYWDPRFIWSRSLLFYRGDFRIAINAPNPLGPKDASYTTFDGNKNPEWVMRVLYDPYGCETDPTYGLPANQVGLYRRPLNAANLAFLARDDRVTTVPPVTPGDTEDLFEIMWDGREPNLGVQFIDAVQFHGQTSATPGTASIDSAVVFQCGMFTAQSYDYRAGDLTNENGTGPSGGPLGGPVNLYNLSLTLRQAVPVSFIPGFPATPVPGIPSTFTPFTGAFGELVIPSIPNFVAAAGGGIPNAAIMTDFYTSFTGSSNTMQASIARGEAIFNGGVTFAIYDEPGVNGALGNPTTGSCSTCHGSVYVGNDAAAPLHRNGIMDNSNKVSEAALQQINLPVKVLAFTPDFPRFAFYCTSNSIPFFSNPVYSPHCPGGVMPCDEFDTTDPGKGLITGKCADLGLMKTPILRGVGARAPYFHNGSAGSLLDVVNFYNDRFNIGLTYEQKLDLVHYLNTL